MNKLGALVMLFVVASPISSILRLSMLVLEMLCPQNDGGSNGNINGNGNNSTICIVQELFTTLALSMPPNSHSHSHNNYGNGHGNAIKNNNIELPILPKGIASYFYHGAANKKNISAHDIMHTLFHHHAMPINSMHMYPLNPSLSLSFSFSSRGDSLNQDLHMVLPWIFAFTALIITPAAMIVIRALSSRGEMETTYRSRKVKIFEHCLEDFQKEVVAKDLNLDVNVNVNGSGNPGKGNRKLTEEKKNAILDNNGACLECHNNNYDDDNSIDGENENEDLICIIPRPGIPLNPTEAEAEAETKTDTTAKTIVSRVPNSENLRQVPGTCAICLSSYKIGETVVWSSNAECPHAFHKNCVLTWIRKRYTSSCPCCRREFIDSDLYSRVKYRFIRKHRGGVKT